jgi:glycosyltransferase involved in cell wall biosynthesis
MRIAMFSYGLPVPGEKRGGIERSAHTLAEGLARRGHQVVVFTHDPKPRQAHYEVRELPWRGFVSTWLGRRVTMGYLGNVLALLPEYGEFEIVVAHGDSLLLPLCGKPIARVMHGTAFEEALHASSPGRAVLQLGVYAQELLSALLVRGTVGVSENTRRANPFVRHVIAHGVDPDIFHPEAASKSSHPSLVFVGALDGRKRGRFLLDLFSRVVRPACPTAELMFVGPRGPEMPGVTYHTGIDDGRLAGLYRSAWICASPSTYEGFGLPYLEAMACGTAVVATPNPGSREVLGQAHPICLPDDERFGRVLVELLGNRRARGALEADGIARARQFSLVTMLDKYEALFEDVRGAHAGSIARA